MKKLISIILIGLAFFLLLAVALYPPQVKSALVNSAALLIVLDDDSEITRCITFDTSEISGEDLLDSSDLDVIFDFDATQGAAVCSIEELGCSAENCFCECQGTDCIYWSYWLREEGAWVYSGQGTSNATAQNGDIQAWVWGTGQDDPPPETTFEDICEAESEETPTPTSTPGGDPTNTPQSTAALDPDVEFWVDSSTIEAGNCTTLNWYAENIKAVYLDGQAVVGEGAETVCPCTTTEYALNVIYPDDSGETFSLEVNVSGVCGEDSPLATPQAPTASPTPTPTDTPEDEGKILPTATSQPEPQPTATEVPLPTATLLPTTTPLPSATAALTATPLVSTTTNAVTSTEQLSPTLATTTDSTITATDQLTPTLFSVEGDAPLPSALALGDWAGYFVFGLLLMSIGGTHLVIQRRSGWL